MLNTKRTRTTVDFKKVRRGKTVPDQSMSIQEIVRRFVRGIPIDVVKREGVYVDQSEHDLEQLSRMEFGDKAAMADDIKARNEGLVAQHEASEREKRENAAKAKQEAQKKRAEKKHSSTLDNTMLNDTNQNVK